MKARFALTALLALTSLTAVACDDEDEDVNAPPDTENFSASLSGAKERPNPSTATATGNATITAQTVGTVTTITYSVVVSGNLTGPVTAAHIHGPAGENAVADPIVTLTVASTALTGTVVTGSFTTTGHPTINITQLLALMDQGQTYINLHTTANPGGEIRGQISD